MVDFQQRDDIEKVVSLLERAKAFVSGDNHKYFLAHNELTHVLRLVSDMTYLQERDYVIKEVAYMLGFLADKMKYKGYVVVGTKYESTIEQLQQYFIDLANNN